MVNGGVSTDNQTFSLNQNESIADDKGGPNNPLPDDKNFRLVQIETNCRRHFKVHLNEK